MILRLSKLSNDAIRNNPKNLDINKIVMNPPNKHLNQREPSLL